MNTVTKPFTPTALQRRSPVPSDLDIAQAASLKPIGQVAAELGLSGAAAWSRIAVTPMIGVNDTSSEVFTTADARQLVDFARSVHLGWLAFWSGARDRACPGGPQSWASPTCSGVAQQPGDFSKAFGAYTG